MTGFWSTVLVLALVVTALGVMLLGLVVLFSAGVVVVSLIESTYYYGMRVHERLVAWHCRRDLSRRGRE